MQLNINKIDNLQDCILFFKKKELPALIKNLKNAFLLSFNSQKYSFYSIK